MTDQKTAEAGADDLKLQREYISINEFISTSRTMLRNSKANPAIAAAMAGKGYPATSIDGALASLDSLEAVNSLQRKEYGGQYEATNAWKQQFDICHPMYIEHLELARLVFTKNPGAQTELQLSGERAKSQSGYLAQGIQFYNAAINSASLQAGLAGKGITLNDLQNGRQQFQQLQALKDAQQKETGEAQEATKSRDGLYDSIGDWIREYRATAKIALRNMPQLMEEIGILQR